MTHNQGWLFLCPLLLFAGCYRQDPLVRASQDLQEAAYDFARQETERNQQFSLLELGMSTNDVLKKVGPPSTRHSLASEAENNREVWTYTRSMRAPATLTFTNQQLTEIRLE
jgi:hypothetical protein